MSIWLDKFLPRLGFFFFLALLKWQKHFQMQYDSRTLICKRGISWMQHELFIILTSVFCWCFRKHCLCFWLMSFCRNNNIYFMTMPWVLLRWRMWCSQLKAWGKMDPQQMLDGSYIFSSVSISSGHTHGVPTVYTFYSLDMGDPGTEPSQLWHCSLWKLAGKWWYREQTVEKICVYRFEQLHTIPIVSITICSF